MQSPPPASVNSFELPPTRSVEAEIRDLFRKADVLLSLLPTCRLRDNPSNPVGQVRARERKPRVIQKKKRSPRSPLT